MALKRSNLKLDSPVNNFATLNSLSFASGNTMHNGNLEAHLSHTNSGAKPSMVLPKSGSWYIEFYALQVTGGNGYSTAGVMEASKLGWHGDGDQIPYPQSYSYDESNFRDGASEMSQTSIFTASNHSYNSAFGRIGTGGVYGLLYDADLKRFSILYNGNICSVDLAYDDKYDLVFHVSQSYGNATDKHIFNFGQNPDFSGTKTGGGNHSDANGRGEFYYKPPWGALALCSANLTAAMNEAPSQNFKAVTWAGDDSGITIDSSSHNLQLTPDLMFIKWRSGVNSSNPTMVYDSVRGFDYFLQTSNTNPESDAVSGIESVGSNSVELKHLDVVNQTGADYVGWFWKAGGAPEGENNVMIDGVGSTMVDSGLDTGDITPDKMSVNTKAGFSIIQYEGTGSAATVPHGLSQAPEFIIVKNIRDNSTNWVIYFKGATTTNQYLLLNSTNGIGNLTNYWGTSEPTNTGFSVAHSSLDNNTTNANHIAYCWQSVPGYSSFGSYTGNGSADGPFVYTGFKPAFLIVKRTTGSFSATDGLWTVIDSTRKPFNGGAPNSLYMNNSDVEFTGSANRIDFLSNGFKLADSNNNVNSSEKFIYMAFAEKPPTVPEKVKYEVSSEPRHSLLFDGENYLKGKWGHLGYQFLHHNYYNDQSYTMSSKFTISFWIKITEQNGGYIPLIRWGDSTSSTVDYTFLGFNDQPKNNIIMNSKVGSVVIDIESTAHTPINSWNHVMWTGEGKGDVNSKFFLNGKETDLSYNIGSPSSGMQRIDNAGQFYMGLGPGSAYSNQFLLSDFYIVESMRLTPEDFCKYENGKLVPKTFDNIPQNTYGMHLDFHPSNMEYDSSGNLTLVKDSSGNGNHLTVND